MIGCADAVWQSHFARVAEVQGNVGVMRSRSFRSKYALLISSSCKIESPLEQSGEEIDPWHRNLMEARIFTVFPKQISNVQTAVPIFNNLFSPYVNLASEHVLPRAFQELLTHGRSSHTTLGEYGRPRRCWFRRRGSGGLRARDRAGSAASTDGVRGLCGGPGAALAELGDCVVCHTAEHGVPYAGGRPLATPFGTIYATNITPDEATGIGNWSNIAFRRAMRHGVSRSGTHLYPALPYEHFTHVNDDDLDAIFAFLMSRPAINAKAPQNELIPPLGFRPLLAGWKLLFLHDTAFVPTPGKSAAWNRGAYLVDGLGHCGGCHTPRNLAGGEETSHRFAGGLADGWVAPPLDAANSAAIGWTEASLITYLRTGIDTNHSAAAGSMGPVIHGLLKVPDADVRAIATYIASLMPPKSSSSRVDFAVAADKAQPVGAMLFEGACSSCHGLGAPMAAQARPGLSLVSAIREVEPTNTIQVILQGLQPPNGEGGPVMPSFAGNLTDQQIADIAAYVRARFTDRPAWSSLTTAVAAARKERSSP